MAIASGSGQDVAVVTEVSDLPAAGTVTMFTTSWCGYCVRLKAQLGRAGIPIREIDIEADEAAAAVVEGANHGNRTVPTVLFPDGTMLTNPSLAQVQAQLS